MHYRILAFDYDGTLAEHGSVPSALQDALVRLRAEGHTLFLVTGRHFEDMPLGMLADLFTGIVWENGAVLYHCATQEVFLPFGTVDPRLVAALEAAHVPLAHGRAIVASWAPHDETVWRVLGEWGGDAAVVHNKGAVMILPPGAAKGPGLERLLTICGLSSRNLAAFGDGENDLSLLSLADLGIAVADAVPALRDAADMVSARPGPEGVLAAIETYWLGGCDPGIAVRREQEIALGETADGKQIGLPGATLASENLGIFGDSGSGKSWVTGLLAEGMHHAGYQILVIDPEGDFRGLRSLPGFVALGGDRELPPPDLAAALLEVAAVSVVLDLCAYPVARRSEYVSDLLRALRPLRQRKYRPHWIALEEAQFFLPSGGGIVETALQPMLVDGGWAFVSYRPDQMAPIVLAGLQRYLLTHLSDPECLDTLRDVVGPAPSPVEEIAPGYVLIQNRESVRLRPGLRRIPHVRHLTKYLDAPLPKHKRFFFRTEQRYLGVEAANLLEFLDCLHNVPYESLVYHQARDDFASWAAGALGDGELAAHLRKLSHRPLRGEALRTALEKRVGDRYRELRAEE